jgi:DNA-binding response OmpR family regulator
MLTAKNAMADVETARRAGVDEYVVKPVSAGHLLTRLAEATMRPRRFIDSPVYVGPCRRRKKDEAYSGPKRRLVDPVDEAQTIQSPESQMAVAKASVSRVAELAKDLRPGDRNQVRALYNCSQETQAVAAAIGDMLLDTSAKSLVRYVEGMGATDRLDPDVVRTHVEALVQLVTLPVSEAGAREHVARGLEAMVQKKLRASADAA